MINQVKVDELIAKKDALFDEIIKNHAFNIDCSPENISDNALIINYSLSKRLERIKVIDELLKELYNEAVAEKSSKTSDRLLRDARCEWRFLDMMLKFVDQISQKQVNSYQEYVTAVQDRMCGQERIDIETDFANCSNLLHNALLGFETRMVNKTNHLVERLYDALDSARLKQ